jgi:hypothetical protein
LAYYTNAVARCCSAWPLATVAIFKDGRVVAGDGEAMRSCDVAQVAIVKEELPPQAPTSEGSSSLTIAPPPPLPPPPPPPPPQAGLFKCLHIRRMLY